MRVRRVMSGVSQAQLGLALGVTFQQVQKYEKGSNRISASRLQEIGGVLGVSASYFFEGAPTIETPTVGAPITATTVDVASFLATPDGARLARAFCLIKSQLVRRRIVDIAEAMDGAGA